MLIDLGEIEDIVRLLDPDRRDCGPLDDEHVEAIEPKHLRAELNERLHRIDRKLRKNWHLGT